MFHLPLEHPLSQAFFKDRCSIPPELLANRKHNKIREERERKGGDEKRKRGIERRMREKGRETQRVKEHMQRFQGRNTIIGVSTVGKVG